MKIEKIYEDNDIIVVYKPAGIATQTARLTEPDMETMVRNEVKKPVFLIHRLDQPVEGVLLFAKSKEAAAGLEKQLQNGQIEKYYLAVVNGDLEEPVLRLDNYIKKTKENKSVICEKSDKDAKKASLIVKKLADQTNAENKKTLVGIHLLTGRHHQIRVQMSGIGHSLVGDKKYGTIKDNEGALKLCNYCLIFKHPTNNKTITVKYWPEFAKEYINEAPVLDF